MPTSASPTGRPRVGHHRRRRRYPMGLALGLCLVSGASAVLMISVPAPPTGFDDPTQTSASAPVSDGVPDDASSTGSTDPSTLSDGQADDVDGQDEDTASPGRKEEEVLLRSVEKEVDSANGDMDTLEGEGDVMGDGPLTTFAVEVEDGLPGEADDFAAAVEEILGDPRSWGNDGERSFQRVEDDDADVRVLLAAPDTVDRLCAPLNTNGYVSCANGNRAIINQNRWVTGVPHFDGDLRTYRIYLINHEVGHTLGHGHVNCSSEGATAPVMQQQTLGLQGCEANGWVHPENDSED